jgi:uncharacterized protein (DUF362 family)
LTLGFFVSDNGKITRREFIKVTSSGVLGLAMTPYVWSNQQGRGSIAQIPPHRVVRVHNLGATNWDFVTDYYWNSVGRDVVDAMVQRGVRELTGLPTVLEAWQEIMSSYQLGDKIAIKINLNGYQTGSEHTQIDALIEVVDGVIGGLVSLGIPQSDVYVFDASRIIPAVRYQSRTLYPQVNFLGMNEVDFNVGIPDEEVHFTHGDLSGVTKYLADVVVNSQHLINIPIMKEHCTGISGAFKNHFGSVNEPIDVMHGCMQASENNPLVDIYLNPHIREKTRLIVGDGLFGMSLNDGGCGSGVPHRWSTFNNLCPNSLFFSVDPVALDSVMLDYVLAERDAHALWSHPHDHLHCAHSSGLGIHEHRDEQGEYDEIDFVDIEMDTSVEQEQNTGPVDRLQLSQNYPNPFNPATVIEYHLNRSAHVVLVLYNVLGEKVITLVHEHQPRGLKRIIWDGRNDRGETVASGVYFCTLRVGEFTQTKRLTLVR